MQRPLAERHADGCHSDGGTSAASSSPVRSPRPRASVAARRSCAAGGSARPSSVGAVPRWGSLSTVEAPPQMPALLDEDRDRLAVLLRRQRERSAQREAAAAANAARESERLAARQVVTSTTQQLAAVKPDLEPRPSLRPCPSPTRKSLVAVAEAAQAMPAVPNDQPQSPGKASRVSTPAQNAAPQGINAAGGEAVGGPSHRGDAAPGKLAADGKGPCQAKNPSAAAPADDSSPPPPLSPLMSGATEESSDEDRIAWRATAPVRPAFADFEFDASDLAPGGCQATLDEFIGGGLAGRPRRTYSFFDKSFAEHLAERKTVFAGMSFVGSSEADGADGGMFRRLRARAATFSVATRGRLSSVANGVTQIARKATWAEDDDDNESIESPDREKYVSDRALQEALEGGDTVLVKGSWLLKRAATMAAAGTVEDVDRPLRRDIGSGVRCSDGAVGRMQSGGSSSSSSGSGTANRSAQPLPRRQELVSRYPGAIWKVDELVDLMAAGSVVVVAASYCWLGLEHPDPRGSQLRLLAHALAQLLNSSPLEDVAVFLDWCSLPQRPRSDAEEKAYHRALQNVHLWYAHQGTRVWMLTHVPGSADRNAAYVARGWPHLERAIGEMTHKPSFFLDFGAMDTSSFLASDWRTISTTCRASRSPPRSPEAFAASLLQKVFGDEADRAVVAETYATTFREVIAAAEELSFSDAGWGDVEARHFAQILPRCVFLRKLALHGNRIGEVGGLAIAAVISRCGALQELWLTSNPIGKSKHASDKFRQAWQDAGKCPERLHF